MSACVTVDVVTSDVVTGDGAADDVAGKAAVVVVVLAVVLMPLTLTFIGKSSMENWPLERVSQGKSLMTSPSPDPWK